MQSPPERKPKYMLKKRFLAWCLLCAVCLALFPSAMASGDPAPAAAESSAPEEAPASEQEPVPEDIPVQEEESVPEEAPAQDDEPAPEEAPVPEETPVQEEAPIPEETPVQEDGAEPDPSDDSETIPPTHALTISILGDSICAYTDYSDGSAADRSNSTIRYNAVYYSEEDISADELWWTLAADALGASILVNNSYSGGCVLSENEPYAEAGTEGWRSRCTQLHDDTGDNAGEEPDIICVYLGKNDCFFRWWSVGSAADIEYDALIVNDGGAVSYTAPETSAEAYAIMIDKITRRYPSAEVYCFTMLPHTPISSAGLAVHAAMNEIIRSVAGHYGLYLVDLDDTGITADEGVFEHYMLDILHPNANGHAAIADVFLQAVRDHVPAAPISPSPFGIMAQPESMTADAGSRAAFTAIGTGAHVAYRWQYFNTYTEEWTDIPGAAYATISFTASPYYDGIQYRCVVTDRSGSTAVSDTATLSVIPRGDVNGDGMEDPLDAALLLQHTAGCIPPETIDLRDADMNGDGQADARDAAAILYRYLVRRQRM